MTHRVHHPRAPVKEQTRSLLTSMPLQSQFVRQTTQTISLPYASVTQGNGCVATAPSCCITTVFTPWQACSWSPNSPSNSCTPQAAVLQQAYDCIMAPATADISVTCISIAEQDAHLPAPPTVNPPIVWYNCEYKNHLQAKYGWPAGYLSPNTKFAAN